VALQTAALTATPAQRRRIELEAAEQWLAADNPTSALTLANRLDFSTDTDDWLLRRQLLISRAQLKQGNTQDAARALKFVGQLKLTPQQRLAAQRLLTTIEQRGDQTTPSSSQGLNSQWLTEQALRVEGAPPGMRKRLQAELLVELLELPIFLLQDREASQLAPAVAPWAALALIMRGGHSPPQRQQQLSQWQLQYAAIRLDGTLLAQISNPDPQASPPPAQIALILPYTGSLSNAGQAVHQGIMASYFANDTLRERTQLRSYDSHDDADIAQLYNQALTDGAEMVIGPLRKQRIEQLAEKQLITVPTLALNQIDSITKPPSMLTQLGLSPEDEIDQLSQLAWALGHHRATAFYPDNQLGNRLAATFEKSWLALGGSFAARQSYAADSSDFSAEIQPLLGLDDSKQRHQRLQRALGQSLQFVPRRRQDIDFIFLAAFPAQARAIQPQFRFHQADDLPIFAASLLYSGIPSQEQNRDLHQVRLCDTPGTFSQSVGHRSLPRIYALGKDAATLIAYLPALKTSKLLSLAGATGRLRIDDHGHVHSHLSCGRFRRGTAEEIATWH
jgi:outer membrane PBP1 activator LpoA protein